MKKRLLSLVLAIVFCVSLVIPAASVSAVEVSTPELEVTSVPSDTVRPMYNAVRAGGSGPISGGYGTISCTLGKYITNAGVQAAVSSSSASGNVTCMVQIPNGTIQYLGTVPASGGSTPIVPMYTLVPGTYTFIFQPTTTASLYVSGYIYE